jgi:P-type conjugative transfer protein TrbG
MSYGSYRSYPPKLPPPPRPLTTRERTLKWIRIWLFALVVLMVLVVYSVEAQEPATAGSPGQQHPDSTPGAVDPVAAATREYQRTGVARAVEEGAFISFPYGHAQPTVTCAPLRACVIELDAGEAVLSKIAGDTQRWEIELAPAGVDGRTPLVVVKPHDCGITTNLVLATSTGRIYDLTLDSPACPHGGVNPHGPYTRHVRFYYPDAMVQTVSAVNPPQQSVAAGPPIAASIAALNFDYHVTRDRHFPWMPAAVFDDGSHCFIKLPVVASHRDAPVLFAEAADGTKALLNYTVSGDTYITDRVFRTGVLVVGEGEHQYTVRLDNRRYDAADASSAAGDATRQREGT